MKLWKPKTRLIPTLVGILIVESVALTCAFIPYTSKAIPSWNILVTDENGRPIVGAIVKQTAAFTGISEKWEETHKTDQNGRASFPERTMHASLMDRVFARAGQKDAGMPYGPLVSAWVCFQGKYGITNASATPDGTGTIHLQLHPGVCPSE
jgi:hypothetical protein